MENEDCSLSGKICYYCDFFLNSHRKLNNVIGNLHFILTKVIKVASVCVRFQTLLAFSNVISIIFKCSNVF
jgi:hypothetical protein